MHKIGILSDTHNLLRESVTDILRGCEVILHGGDIHTKRILDQLNEIAPVYAVRGNADKEWADILPQSLSIELFGIRIFMIHNQKMIQEDIHDRDLIIYGHSHKYEKQQKNGQIWLNPGSCGRRRFSLPVTMAVLTVPEYDDFHSGNPDFQIEQIHLESHSVSDGNRTPKNMKQTVTCVMKETDKGRSVAEIARICRIHPDLAEQICRLYLTHPGVDADGILGKMGL